MLRKPLLILVQKATLASARAGILETDTSILISGTKNAPTSTRAPPPPEQGGYCEDRAPMQPFYPPNMHVVVAMVSHQEQSLRRKGVVR